MNGHDLKHWRKANGYKNQDALQLELGIGSRRTISVWENSENELPRMLELALAALERCPDLRKVSGTRHASATQVGDRTDDKRRAPTLDDWKVE